LLLLFATVPYYLTPPSQTSWTESELLVASNWSDGNVHTLTLVEGTTYKDDIFTYTRSGNAPNYLYTRTHTALWIASSCGIDLSTPITDRKNGMVYISTASESEDLRALVVTNLVSRASPNIVCEAYNRISTSKLFYRHDAEDILKLNISSIEGNQSTGYYLTNSDYTTTSSISSNGRELSYYFTVFMYSWGFSDRKSYKDYWLTGYNPSCWAKWADIEDEFVGTYPSNFETNNIVSGFYQKNHIPIDPSLSDNIVVYGTFSKALIPVDDGTFKEDEGGDTTLRYTRSGTDPNYLYTRK
jgi:hypothetical protein